MRCPTTILCANGRRPQLESAVPFQEILPLRLKNRVSGKADSGSEVACLYEMSLVFACLKNHEFAEKYCEKEIGQFKQCYQSHIDQAYAAKTRGNLGIITPGNKLNSKQLNKYFRRFPSQ